MGNHGSRKDQRKWGKQGGKAANALTRVEELRGPSVDSYDKLIAWLAEMAEHDNVQLDTSVFVSQLNRVCQKQAEHNHLEGSANAGSGSLLVGGSASGGGGSRAPNTRQNSTSCDSHVSHASSDVTQRNRSSTRSDDFLDPSSAWRSGVSTRQNTFSDDLEEEEDSELRNASVESLYSNTDRDSELGSILAYDATCRRSGRNCNFQSSSPLLRANVAKRLRFVKGNYVLAPCSASFGNLDLYDRNDVGTTRCLAQQYVKKSVSLLDLSKTEAAIAPQKTIPKVVLTRDSDVDPESRPLLERTVIRKKLGSGPKSLSLTSQRKKQARLERHFSLHSDPCPFPSTMFGGFLPPIFTIPPTEEATPVKSPADDAAAFLDDDLLDRNIADILFSVEALWPKK